MLCHFPLPLQFGVYIIEIVGQVAFYLVVLFSSGVTFKGSLFIYIYTSFFYKNLFYKNVEAGIGQKFKNMLRTYPG